MVKLIESEEKLMNEWKFKMAEFFHLQVGQMNEWEPILASVSEFERKN